MESNRDYHALVVGVGKYDHWPVRPKSVRNARDMSNGLRQLGISVQLLIDPTHQKLRTALEQFVQKAENKAEIGLIFYYSGNSQTHTAMGDRKLGWIIAKDVPLPRQNRQDFEETAISTDELAAIAGQNQSGHVLFLFDAALSGDTFQVEPPMMRMIGKTSALPTRQFITAGKTEEPVYEFGAFNRFLLQGLGGDANLIQDGIVSGSELGLYVSERVAKATGGRLHPQFGKIAVSGDNRGDFMLQQTDRTVQTARLIVEPQPATAATRIMDSDEEFMQGMALEPGKYRLQISAVGYETIEKTIDMKAGEDHTVKIKLSKVQEEITNSIGMLLVRIRQGRFKMGSPASEPGRSIDETQHSVVLSRPFFMQSTEVTVGQFTQFVQATGYTTDAENGGGCWITSHGSGWTQKPKATWKNPGLKKIDDGMPAICLSWQDAKAFTRWLSQKEGKTYRLPTEAQWEYAARAGIATPFSTGRCLSTDEANYGQNSHQFKKCLTVYKKKRNRPINVGQLTPNPWRLHNIHGNVSEWCLDWYGPYPAGHSTDPSGPRRGSERVMRGGHWQADAAGCRSAVRRRFPPNFASDVVGFRIVLIP